MSFPVGVQMMVLCGSQEAPTPLGATLTDLLASAEVTEVADGQSGFQLIFGGARDNGGTGIEYAVLEDGRLQPGRRVIVAALLNRLPTPIMDGLVTGLWVDPGSTPGNARVVVNGADLSVAMDSEERIASYPDMNEAMIAADLIGRYARFAIEPEIVPPEDMELPTVLQRTPMQHGTDLDQLYRMADRFGYHFTVRPGAVPGTNVAYWGPPRRVGKPLPALTVGGSTLDNVDSLTFTLDGLSAISVSGLIPAPAGAEPLPVVTPLPTLEPPLSRNTPYQGGGLVRRRLLAGSEGFGEARAMALAQGRVNRSAGGVAQAEGQLDVVRYGGLLRAGSLVGVRGGGASFDGLWAVNRVVHRLRRQQYRQSFSLGRDGTGSTVPVVAP